MGTYLLTKIKGVFMGSSIHDYSPSQQPQVPPSVGPTGPDNVGPQPPPSAMDKRSVSTLSRSQVEALLTALYASNSPMLSPPGSSGTGISGAVAALDFQNQYNKIVLAVLDKWSENLAEIKQRIDDEMKSPAYRAKIERESSAAHAEAQRMSPEAHSKSGVAQSTPASERIDGLRRDHAVIAGLQDSITQFRNDSASSAAAAAAAVGLISVMASGFVVDVSFKDGIPSISSVAAQVDVSAFQEAFKAAGVGYQDTFAAQLGLIGALFSAGLQQFSVAEVEVSRKGGKADSGEAAKKYAENVQKFIKSDAFNNFVAMIVSNVPGVDKMKPTDKAALTKEILSTMRYRLLASAAVEIYKANVGWLKEPIDIKNLVTGNIKLDPTKDGDKKLIAAGLDSLLEQLKGELKNIPANRTEFAVNGAIKDAQRGGTQDMSKVLSSLSEDVNVNLPISDNVA